MNMGDYLSVIDALSVRLQGPIHFRFVLQPLTALFFAVRDFRRDEREGRPPFFVALLAGRGHRQELVLSAWKSIGKVFVLAVILDLVFQYIALGVFHPAVSLLTGLILAVVPYLLLRGPVSRLLRRKSKGEKP
jgi:hypothetical protein